MIQEITVKTHGCVTVFELVLFSVAVVGWVLKSWYIASFCTVFFLVILELWFSPIERLIKYRSKKSDENQVQEIKNPDERLRF